MILIFISGPSYSQGSDTKTTVYNKFSVELNGGLLSHYGDIKRYRYYPGDELSFGGGFGLNYHVSPLLTLRGSFLAGQLVGEMPRDDRHFENNFMEYTFNGIINFNQLFAPNSRSNEFFSIYGVAGVGVISYRSQLMTISNDQVLDSYGYASDGTTKEDRVTDMTIPFGMGLKFRLSERFDVGIESAFRATKTDRLDAVDRGRTAHDMYNYTSVGITIRLGKNTKTPYWASAAETVYPGDVQRMDKLANQVSAAEEKVVQLEQTIEEQDYDKDITELRQGVSALEEKNNELSMRMHQMHDRMGVNADASTAALLSVYFNLNSAALDATNYERVAAAARFMQANPDVNIELVGHADSSGPDRFNRILSERRAQTVHDALVNDFRIDTSRLSVSYRGTEDPMSDNNTDVNRRVDFKVVE
ncbi:MAG: OmpA family protein [Bacteroidales bacterium]